MVIKNKKDIDYYLNLPWSYTVETITDNGKILYVIKVNELPGIATDAPNIQEAMELIKDAMIGAFELYLENDEEVPEPVDESKYKGNIAYRTTSGRHYKLIREAKRKNVSISQIIDNYIDIKSNKK